ncbi:MAG TPA: sulfurtransferase [Candidatus Acidoferrales bacterium]|nr:sulfurtransferase [Candidatus Acidoferrales bacterium]
MSRDAFIEVAWLAQHLHDPNVRVVDARSTPHGAPGQTGPSGAEQYAARHIPGAVHLDYADHLADPATPYAARVAPPQLFAEVMERRGIGDRTTVIAYDDGTVPYAARMIWMLRYYGHDDAKILAGGLPAWIAGGHPVTSDVPTAFAPAIFTPRVRPELRASREEVLAVARGERDAQLLETQRNATYATRDRDIAGSVRLSGNDLLEDERGGAIADRAKLDRLVGALGLDKHKRTIVSCGSGVSASGSYLALLEAGFTDLAVYDGSWMEWSHDGLPTVVKSSSVPGHR